MDFDDDGLFADEELSERPPMLPPLSPGQSALETESEPARGELVAPRDEGGEGNDPSGNMPKPRVRRNVVKLDSERIINRKRGLPRLVKDFSKLKFKGKGYEASDIKKLMKEYELWANRLFPKYQFDQVLIKIEGPQGSKKEVKDCMRKLRRGELMEDEEIHSDIEGENGADRGDVNMADFGGDVRMENMDLASPSEEDVRSTPAPLTLSDETRELMRRRREEALARLAQRQSQKENEKENQNNTQEEEDEEEDPLSPPNLIIADTESIAY